MRWTPDKILALKSEVVGAMTWLADHETAADPRDRWRGRLNLVGSTLLLTAGCVLWERAAIQLGAPALRPLHRLLLRFFTAMNDPPLGVADGGEDAP